MHSAISRRYGSCSSSVLIILLFTSCICAQAFAAAPPGPEFLQLNTAFSDARAHWTVLSSDEQSMRIEMRLSSLLKQDLTLEGETWQILSIDRGGLAGQDGTPGLPTTGHLIAVPSNVMVDARIVDFDLHQIDDLRLMPVQPGDATGFHFDRDAYGLPGMHSFQPGSNLQTLPAINAQKSDAVHSPPVHFAQPAMMAGQAVLPLTVGAVSYDPVARTAVVATRVEIELSFSADKSGRGLLSPTSRRESVGPAFKSALQDKILGSSDGQEKFLDGFDPGTWAVVCYDTTVLRHVQPLIWWRARQGYHVEVIVSSADNSAIKNQLQSIYDDASIPPLQFILLAGDTDFFAIPAFDHGDHDYTTLDGDDILSDTHIGRLSFTQLDVLDIVINKITKYEINPFMEDTDWFQRACVIGDPSSSGISTIYVNQWLKEQFLANRYTAVDTIWGGNYVGQMMASVNQGVSAIGYRGFAGASGISYSYIHALENSQQLPVAIFLTCRTGNFNGPDECLSESWLRASNGGAVAAIGTATSDTHTRYNNCMYHGIWDGLLNTGDTRIGPALTLGKLEVFNNYYLAEPLIPYVWAEWNNIMGDGATQIWQGVPQELAVNHPNQVSVGSNAVEISVETEGQPVSNAWVCLYRENELRVTGLTDENGQVFLVTPPLTTGLVQVTVTGPDLQPYLADLHVGTLDIFCALAEFNIDDDASGLSDGNGDSLLNPGETVELAIAVTNQGAILASGVTATLDAGNPLVSTGIGTLEFGHCAPGTPVWADNPAVVTIDPATPDGCQLALPLLVTDGSDSWISVIQLPVHAAAFSVTGTSWSAGPDYEPGQSGQLVVELTNTGSINAEATSVLISSTSPWLAFPNNGALMGDVPSGNNGSNTASPFLMEIDPNCYPGHLAVLQLDITYNNGIQTSTDFTVTVGSAEPDDPTGPDAYGYYAFDNTDASSFYAPVYNWVDLDPTRGGVGTSVGLEDFGGGQHDTKTINLPFTFRYYGVDFQHASICSNGWMAMGETQLVHYRNYSIPSKGSPRGMIAPFWDNLRQDGDNLVYSHYDETGHRFIVQWSMVTNEFSDSFQNFEVILLDPAWHPTPTGDGAIIFQYETVNNTDSINGFATIGIQNLERTNGVLYSYFNQYAAGAAPVQSGRAIKFQPLGEIQLPVPGVSVSSLNPSLGLDESTQMTIQISNAGHERSFLDYRVCAVDPATMEEESNKGFEGSTMTLSAEEYEPGSRMEIDVIVDAVIDGEFIKRVSLVLPPGVTLHTSENMSPIGVFGGLPFAGPIGDGVTATWESIHQLIWEEREYRATTDFSFDINLTDDLVFGWSLDGQSGSANPGHESGTILLEYCFQNLRIQSPDEETIATIGQITRIEFNKVDVYGGEVSGMVDIALQRQPDGPWETLATSVSAPPGTWNWLVSGEPGPYAVIRITDSTDDAVFQESDTFVVSRNLDWVSLSPAQGSLASNQATDLIVSIDATGLDYGLYSAVLLISTSSGETLTVPINLTVDPFALHGNTLPRTVALIGNYPNPFNPSTTFSFTLPGEMAASMEVYSTRGMRVRRLLNETLGEGVHEVVWDGTDDNGRAVPSGVYFCRLVTPGKSVTEKVVLAK